MNKILITALLLCSATMGAAKGIDTTKVYPIGDVSISSYRSAMRVKDAPNKVELITRREIKSIPAQNIAEIIKKLSDADAVDMQGVTGGIDFRGYAPSAAGTNSYTRLLVDGIPMSTHNTSATSLSNINSIEILKGPFSSLYGSGAMGGVINVIPLESRGDITGSASFGYGSFNTINVNAQVGGNISRRVDMDVYANIYNQNNNYKTGGHNLLKMSSYEKKVMDPNSYSAIYPNSRYDSKSGGIRFGFDLSEKWRMNLHNDIYYTGRGEGNGMLWGMYEQTDKKIFRNAHRLDIKGTEGAHSLRFTPFYSMEHSDYNNDFGYMVSTTRNDYSTWGALLSDAVTIGNQTIIFGIDNFSQKYLTKQWKQDGSPDAPFQPNYLNMQTGIFAQGNLSYLDNKLTASVGVRYDNVMLRTYATPLLESENDTKYYNTINPNIAVKYKVTPTLSVRGSVGSAFLAPDAFKMAGEYTMWGTTYKGNSKLKAENSITYDFGVSFTDRKKAINADLTMFSTNHKNLIINDYSFTDQGYVTYTNANKADVKGLEYLLSVDFGRLFDKNYSLRLYGSYTHIFKSAVEIGNEIEEKKYISRDKASMGVDFIMGRFSARINGRYTGYKVEDNWIYQMDYNTYERSPFVTKNGIEVRPSLINDNTVKLPDFMVFDLYADFMVTKNFSVGVKLYNLLDENYMERDGYYMPGRNFSVNVSYKF